MGTKNQLIQELEAFVKVTGDSNPETNYHAYLLSKAVPVQVVSIREVFTEQEINKIKMYVKPKKKECWRNAALLSIYFPNVEYVEGKMLAVGIIGIDHAFNKVRDKYIDITAELCLNNLNTDEGSYIKIQEYSGQEVVELSEKFDCYRCYHEPIFLEKLRKTYYAKKENRLQQDRLPLS